MNLLPLSLVRTYRGAPVPQVPTNLDRIRAWQAARPAQLGNSLPWKWEAKRCATTASRT